MKAIKRLFFGAFCLILFSCGPKIVFEETVGFENEVWAYGDSLNFGVVGRCWWYHGMVSKVRRHY